MGLSYTTTPFQEVESQGCVPTFLHIKPHGPLLQDMCFEMGTRVFWDQELPIFWPIRDAKLGDVCKTTTRRHERKKKRNNLTESASRLEFYTFGSNLVTSRWKERKEVDSSKHHNWSRVPWNVHEITTLLLLLLLFFECFDLVTRVLSISARNTIW